MEKIRGFKVGGREESGKLFFQKSNYRAWDYDGIFLIKLPNNYY